MAPITQCYVHSGQLKKKKNDDDDNDGHNWSRNINTTQTTGSLDEKKNSLS